MFGKRVDGRQVHEVEPFQRIVPYIMRTRTDSMNMFEEGSPPRVRGEVQFLFNHTLQSRITPACAGRS